MSENALAITLITESCLFEKVHKVLKMLEAPYSNELSPLKTWMSEDASASRVMEGQNELSSFDNYFNKPPLHAVGVGVT